MSDWLGGMSQNLAADVLLLALVFFIGRRLVERSVVDRVVTSAEKTYHDVDIDEEPYTYSIDLFRARIDNLSTEPIYDAEAHCYKPKRHPRIVELPSHDPLVENPERHQLRHSEDPFDPPEIVGAIQDRIPPGGTAYGPWYEEGDIDFIKVEFTTVRGLRYDRRLNLKTPSSEPFKMIERPRRDSVGMMYRAALQRVREALRR